jgi:hypothetical protein
VCVCVCVFLRSRIRFPKSFLPWLSRFFCFFLLPGSLLSLFVVLKLCATVPRIFVRCCSVAVRARRPLLLSSHYCRCRQCYYYYCCCCRPFGFKIPAVFFLVLVSVCFLRILFRKCQMMRSKQINCLDRIGM